MKHGTMEQALVLTAITLICFGFLAGVAFAVAWKRRHDRGHSQILARRGAWLGGIFITLAPLCFMGALWINVPGSPIRIHDLTTARTVTSALSWTTSVLVLCAALCAIFVVRSVLMAAKEQVDMTEVRQPYQGTGPDHGGD